MKKNFISTLVVILVGIGTAAGQQIPMFNSYTLNKFLINPSYAGASGKTNILESTEFNIQALTGLQLPICLLQMQALRIRSLD